MKPKILHVIDHADSGGAQIVLRDIIKELRGHFDFMVAILGKAGNFVHVYESLGVPVFRLEAGRWNPLAFFKLVQLMRHRKPTLVHTHLFKSTIIGTMAAKLSGCRSILHDHASFNAESLRFYFPNHAIRKVYSWLYRSTLRCTDRVIVLTSGAKSKYVDANWVESSKIEVVPNGIDVANIQKQRYATCSSLHNELKLSENVRLIVMVGRMEPEKDYPTFFHVAQIVSQVLPQPCAFLVVGSGSEEAKVRHCIETYKLHNVFLLGHRHDVGWILSQVDVFLLTSRFEAFSIAVLEAMAAGCPVVATRSTGPQSILVHEFNGLLADVEDDEMLAQNVVRLLGDDKLRSRLVHNACVTVSESYTVQQAVSCIAAIYERACFSDEAFGSND